MRTDNDTTSRTGIVRLLREVWDRKREAAMRRANMRELDTLSDHLLRDIGYDPSGMEAGLRRPRDHRPE
ncbi:hypothetical protein DPQ33_03715 [Oceanidesulfovibrio indonesiensis]|jgi:uncharacterized protein YjiS (DUF1127 family)|uniref:YjiS-like domain-containing protein n=1 Tax=Oceanidesulfovibrio indonesiensis TaxID=54767 RepID=A0A7M3MJ93_9BACT|nr:DUF1127 domain-containing protein [Oceanidesulfovibrio indonesiensis]TVM19475.1 hypothetical protein DPQ33_03715 [Oceanidesulfovibrio indonesiensis]